MELYISDLDGTLLDDKAEITEETARLINSAVDKGACFTAATARTFASVGKIMKDIKLRFPLILMNGVLIYDTQEQKYIFSAFLEPQTVRAITASLRRHNADPFVYTVENDCMHTYYEKLSSDAMTAFYEERCRKYYKSFSRVDSLDDICKNNIIYFTLINSYEALLPVYNEVSKLENVEMTFYRDVYSPDLWYIEIFSGCASKKKAVEFLRNYLHPEKIICFGDNLNDIPMFEAADHSVAVENAVAAVKEAADEIIGKNTDNAVAAYISERFR
ncbi:MAG: Cof-type HAD-IIB family hydrolase [Oscillospiraceae bacterium]